jgi:hypothetical protein
MCPATHYTSSRVGGGEGIGRPSPAHSDGYREFDGNVNVGASRQASPGVRRWWYRSPIQGVLCPCPTPTPPLEFVTIGEGQARIMLCSATLSARRASTGSLGIKTYTILMIYCYHVRFFLRNHESSWFFIFLYHWELSEDVQSNHPKPE